MKEQDYSNHMRLVAPFHFVLFPILLATLVGACVNLYKSIDDHQRLYSAALLVALSFGVLMLFFFCRIFALKAQDRAIRAEENLRHFAMTGKLMDPRLTTRQVIGLRFASDAEFVALAAKAAEEGTDEKDIKKSVKHWRADNYRV